MFGCIGDREYLKNESAVFIKTTNTITIVDLITGSLTITKGADILLAVEPTNGIQAKIRCLYIVNEGTELFSE